MKPANMSSLILKMIVVCLAITGLSSQAQTAAPAKSAAAAPDKTAITPVTTELVGWLDSKKAKAGDTVVLKTTQTVRTSQGTEIKKGTKLVGTILVAHSYKKGEPGSQLTLQFDYADLGGGKKLALNTRITSVKLSDQAANNADHDSTVGGKGSAVAQGSVSATSGRGSVVAVGSAPSYIGDLTAQPSTFGGGPSVATAQNTGIPGLILTVSTGDGTVAGILSVKGNNILLDSGTHFSLVIIQR